MPVSTLLLQTLEDLKKLPQWVCFSPKKRPYDAKNDQDGETDNPETWSTYQEALAAWKRKTKKYAGVGFVFVASQGITGIDLDKCIDDQGTLTTWAREVVDRLNSYTEVSPSGTGLHIWVRGSIPKAITPKPESAKVIEMYNHVRFFTITGNHFAGTPRTFEDRQEVLSTLHSEIVELRRVEAAAIAAAKKSEKTAKKTTTSTTPDGNTKYALAALENECSTLASTGDGGRNSQLNTSAYALGQLVAGGELTESIVVDRLTASAERAGLEPGEIEKTLQSGLAAGKLQPRNTPEKNTNQDQAPIKKTDQTDLPEIIIGSQLRETMQEVLNAMTLAQGQERTIFVYASQLVKVTRDKKKNPMIFHLGVAEIKNVLTKCANFYKLKKVGDGYIQVNISPTKEIAEQIIAMEPCDWPFPELRAIVEMPVLRPDGSILDTPGFDVSTGLYYMGNDQMRSCKIPHNPTRTDIEKACGAIETCIGEFPYEMEADHANAYGLLLTLATRYIYDGDVQIGLINAVKPGTGKGLLAHVASVIATGRTAPITSFPNREEETKKVIDSQALAGVSILMFDNIKRTFTSTSLDALATCQGLWMVRPLGQSKNVPCPVSMTIIASGNNIQLDTDMARRCFQIRLISSVSSPDERDDFIIKNLIEYTLEHRAELVAALLTLARAWYAAGKPSASSKLAISGSSFKHWANTVGGILENAGIQGFQGNRDALKAEANEEENQTYAFLSTWFTQISSEWISSKTLVDKIKPQNVAGSDEESPANLLAEMLPDDLKETLQNPKKSFPIVLGKWLRKRVKTPYGPDNIHIEGVKDDHTNVQSWRVVASSASSASSVRALYAGEKKTEKKSSEEATASLHESIPGMAVVTTRTTRTTRNPTFTDTASNGSTPTHTPQEASKKVASSPDTLLAKKACPEVQERFLTIGARLDYPRLQLSSSSWLPVGQHSWTIYASSHTDEDLLRVVERVEQEAV